MDDLRNVTFDEFSKALTPQWLRNLRIIQSGLGSGVFVFCSVVFLLSSAPQSSQQPKNSVLLLSVLSFVHMMMAMGVYAASAVVYNMLFSDANLTRLSQKKACPGKETVFSPAVQCLSLIFTASIVRLAMMEGAAFFGLVVCLLGVQWGVIETRGIYWGNLFSTVIFLAYVIYTFPTRERIEDIFKAKISSMYKDQRVLS